MGRKKKKRKKKKKRSKANGKPKIHSKTKNLQSALGSKFQPLMRIYESFRGKSKKEKFKQEKLRSKERETQIKEEQKEIKEEERKLHKEEEERLRELNLGRNERDRQIKEEEEERKKLDPIYKEIIAKVEQEKLVQFEEVAKLKEKRILDERQAQERIEQVSGLLGFQFSERNSQQLAL